MAIGMSILCDTLSLSVYFVITSMLVFGDRSNELELKGQAYITWNGVRLFLKIFYLVSPQGQGY